MAQSLIQTSFYGGELSPNLYGMVDLAHYKKSVAKMRNFFPDYRGGASTRFGTKYVIQALNSNFPVRLIPFKASFDVTYVLEFGQNYIRFHTNGGPVIEATFPVSAMSGNTITTSGVYNVGDWLFVNGNYYIITNVSGSVYTVTDLYGHPPSLSGTGTAARIYTIQSPYAGADLALVKYAQNVQFMVLCHPNYPAQLLTFNGPTNWVLTTITYGATITAPTGVTVSQHATGTPTGWDTAYQVTAVDINGQESTASDTVSLINKGGLGSGAAAQIYTNTVTWTAVPGALYYNIYRSPITDTNPGIPAGTLYGLIASTQATSYTENTSFTTPVLPLANFSITPPQPQNPFLGGPVSSVTVTTPGTYTAVPTVSFAAPPTGGATASGSATLGVATVAIINGGVNYSPGDSVFFQKGVVLIVKTVSGGGGITAYQSLTYPGTSVGAVTAGAVPATLTQTSSPGGGVGAIVGVTWGVVSVQMLSNGAGYITAPAVTFSPAGAAATAVLGPVGGNPSVPCYFQQRLVLAAPLSAPQTLYFSVPGAPYNFNTHLVAQADDAITAILVSKELNVIKSMVPMPAGLVVLTSTSAWLINGGSGAGSPVTPINISAQSEAYNGANDVPPQVVNDDLLYVQAKGAIVRDLRYNFYTAVYTGTDISVLAEHLFYGYQLLEWTWGEEPLKIVWVCRNDGVALSLTFSKEQELAGWSHHDTQGLFQSVTDVGEHTPNGSVSAVYFVVQRVVNGQILKYIERLADRFLPYGIEDTWALDCAIQSKGTAPAAILTPGAASGSGVVFTASAGVFNSGQVGNVIRVGGGIATITGFISATQVICNITQPITTVFPNGAPKPAAAGNWTVWVPSTIFTGLAQLEGQVVTALADGVPVVGLTVLNGAVTLPSPATKVTVGLPFVCQLQTLPLDAGQPTIQGKRKRAGPMSFKATDTRGLAVGRTFSTMVNVKDAGAPMLSAFPNLVFGDEWVVLDSLYDPYGQVCFQQTNPWPATIMAVIPDVEVGDSVR